jgi:ATP phosphoribosyltransferase
MSANNALLLTLPKGRIQERVMALLGKIGLTFRFDSRSYRPTANDDGIQAKLLKPQNIPALIALGRHDCGFTGHDWIVEQNADLVELLDLGFDPVRIVAAVPDALADTWQSRPLIVASEYQSLSQRFIQERGLNAVFVRTYGATEALPPEDADMIIDNTATGATLRLNRLTIVDEVLRSTTRFVCSKAAFNDPAKRQKLDELVMLMRSVLNAEQRVLVEMNVSADDFDRLVANLPAMRSPTVSPLYQEAGFAVKIAVPAKEVPLLIPRLMAAGARDILEYRLEKIVH